MNLAPVPIDPGDFPPTGRPDEAYALVPVGRLVKLVRAMPDSQSAVLVCLAWQASLQERLRRGPFAGKPVARLSGRQLAEMTGRPLRTVRYALARLIEAGTVRNECTLPGRKAIYVLPAFVADGDRRRPPSEPGLSDG
jgi:hypothetical protein